MHRLFVILKWVVYSLVSVAAISVAAVILFARWLDSNSVNSYSEAQAMLKKHGATEYKTMIEECAKLYKLGRKQVFSDDEIPSGLQYLSPQYVRVSRYNCEVNLYKTPGKGIGYFIKQNKNGQFEISWHNYFQSWESHKIEF